MTSSSISRPCPPLPVELRSAIISECDTGTLAIACRVSFEFLETASRLLCDHVEITSWAQAQLLFCSLDESEHIATISPHLSLYRIRSVSISIPEVKVEFGAARIHKDRLPTGRIPLARLRYASNIWYDRVPTSFDGFFDPLEISAVCAIDHFEMYFSLNIDDGWTRLRDLSFKDIMSNGDLASYDFIQRLDSPLRITYDLSDAALDVDEVTLLWDLGCDKCKRGLEAKPCLPIRADISVVLRLQSQRTVEDLRAAFFEMHEEGDAHSEVEIQRHWDAIVFEPYTR